jgi:predicted transcriptional regulator
MKPEFFQGLANPVRLQILEHLLSGHDAECVMVLAKHVKRDQSVVFRHVGVLEHAGIVRTEKVGKCLNVHVKDPYKLKRIMEAAK